MKILILLIIEGANTEIPEAACIVKTYK